VAKHWNRWTLARKGALLVAGPALFQILFLAALWWIEKQHDRERQAELRAKDAVSTAHRILGLHVDGETALRGYALTNDRRFAEPYDRATTELDTEQAHLRSFAAHDHLALADIESLGAAVAEYHRHNHALLDQGRREEVIATIARGEGRRRMDAYRDAIARFLAVEHAQEIDRGKAAVSARHRVNLAIAAASAAQLVFAASVAFFFTKNIAGRLHAVLENMDRLERGETLHAGVGGADEIAGVERRFHEMAAAIERGRTELQTANAGLESFSYSVSHDLRAPIRAIDGYAQILEEDYAAALDGEGKRYLDVIRSESRRMAALIDDLLAFARFGRQALKCEPVDIRQLAIDTMRDVRADRDLAFTADDAPPALADRATLRQVLINLLSNAAKYSKPDRRAEIEFGGRKNGGNNVYWVRDNGIGFDMQYARKLFGVFQRLHTDSSIEGTGVGLAIVQRIVARHGGEVWAESEEGKGATFFFSLPAVTEEPQ
jgi:signal transduction histidine kinase